MDKDIPQPAPRKEAIVSPPEYSIDLDNLPQQQHRWIDRGLKLSCEGAGHPMHQAWKRTVRRT